MLFIENNCTLSLMAAEEGERERKKFEGRKQL